MLPQRPPTPRGSAIGPAAAARLGAAAAAAQRSSQQGQGAGADASAQGPITSPFGPRAASPRGGMAGRSSADRGCRRDRTGKHPANLQHCSTEPPGAIDELAELLLAAANRVGGADAGALGSAGSGLGSTSADSSSTGGASAAAWGSSQHPAAGSARVSAQPSGDQGQAPVRRSAPAAAAAEPRFTSQVALLAQQLLQQQQHGGGGGPTQQLRSSLEQPWQPPPLSRSRTAGADELLRGRPTAADMLRGLAGSGGSGPQVPVEATPVLKSLDAAHQPRFSGPAPQESAEKGTPFSAIQGEEGVGGVGRRPG